MADSGIRKPSARLESILELIEPCELLGDVGTDHALVLSHAVLRGLAQRGLGVDVNEEPLRRARQTLERLGVADRIELRLGDGLAGLGSAPVDTLVLAGLGGETLLGWCRAAPERLRGVRRLLVQPNRQLGELRAWAYGEGHWLLDENIVEEAGRAFVTCAFALGRGPADPAYAEFEVEPERLFELGPWLLRRREPLAARYYEEQRKRLASLVQGGREDLRSGLEAFEWGRRIAAEGS
ncbi:MAG TPA: class I SAM-dependent methyltransferase [Polyangiaceae bacterium]|nr:class I SAM-dependent methyltransferase [Polyangiaceae bacterium]